MKKMFFEKENGEVVFAQKATARQIYGDKRAPKTHYEYLGFSGFQHATSAGVLYECNCLLFKNNKNEKYYFLIEGGTEND